LERTYTAVVAQPTRTLDSQHARSMLRRSCKKKKKRKVDTDAKNGHQDLRHESLTKEDSALMIVCLTTLVAGLFVVVSTANVLSHSESFQKVYVVGQ